MRRPLPRFLLTGVAPSVAAALATFTAAAAVPPVARPVDPRMLLLDGVQVDRTLVVVGERGTILTSHDQAVTWFRASSPTRATLTGVAFAAAQPPQTVRRGWAVGHDAIILTSEDAGRTWTRQYQGENLQESFLDVTAIDDRRAIAIGAYGLYFSTADGGRTWERRKLRAEDYHFNRITRGPAGHLYIAGEAGTLLRSIDDGASWTPLRVSYDGSFYGILPLERQTLLAHGLRGHIYRSDDDGATWHEVASPTPVLLAAGLQLQGNHVLLAGHARTLLVSRDQGKSFASAAHPLMTGIAEMLELAEGKFLALGEAGASVLTIP